MERTKFKNSSFEGIEKAPEKEVDAAAPGLEMRGLQVKGLKVLALGLEHVAPARNRVHGGRGVEPGRRVAALSPGIVVEVLQKARVRGHGGKDADGKHEGEGNGQGRGLGAVFGERRGMKERVVHGEVESWVHEGCGIHRLEEGSRLLYVKSPAR